MISPRTASPMIDSSVIIAAHETPAQVAVNWLDRELHDPQDQREYAQEKCITVVTELVAEAIGNAGLTRAAVAEQLGVSKGYISQILGGGRNMTLRTLGDLLWVTKQELTGLRVGSLGVSFASPEIANEWDCRHPISFRSARGVLVSYGFSAEMTDHVDPPAISNEESDVNLNLALAA